MARTAELESTMSKTLEILELAELKEQIKESQDSLKATREQLEPLPRFKALWETSSEHFYRNGHSERAGFLRTSMELARQMHGAGSPPQEVRRVLQEGFEAYAPIVSILDFSVSVKSYSVAKALAKKFDGREVNAIS